MNFIFANRVKELGTTAIRGKIQVPADFGMISFANGNPSADMFPIEDIEESASDALVHWEKIALQYAPSEGFPALREALATRMNRNFKTNFPRDSLCITTGSQQALDIVGKMFLNEGDVVLCEVPLPLSVIMAFSKYSVRFVEIASDELGMDPDDVDAVLRQEKNAKIVFIAPDFMRPSGKSWSVERRRKFLDVVAGFDVAVVEDLSMSELCYDSEILPAVASFDTRGQVITVGSVSRVLCPGLRIGWIASSQELTSTVQTLKRSTDLSTSSLDQCVLEMYMEKFDFDLHIKALISSYRDKRDLLDSAMREEFPKPAKFEKPEGGMFTWVDMENGVKANDLLEKCIEQQVSFVPAEQFFPNGGGRSMFRLSFSAIPRERIRSGVKRIARAMTALGTYQTTRVTIAPKYQKEKADVSTVPEHL